MYHTHVRSDRDQYVEFDATHCRNELLKYESSECEFIVVVCVLLEFLAVFRPNVFPICSSCRVAVVFRDCCKNPDADDPSYAVDCTSPGRRSVSQSVCVRVVYCSCQCVCV